MHIVGVSVASGVDATRLEEPLPKPSRDPLGYASARTLEAILEALLALEYIREGYTRNAAGKAFQAWRALTAALLVLEKSRITSLLESSAEKRWLTERAVPRVPTSRLKRLAMLLEEVGYRYYSPLTDKALDLYDYQYHGPDPDLELSKYRSREEAVSDIIYLLERLVEIISDRLKPVLVEKRVWSSMHEEALETLRERLKGV